MDSYADTNNDGHNGGETWTVAETRSTHDSLDKDSVVNELGSGPEPVGLRIDFEKE